MIKLIQVTCAIIEHQGQVLVAQRSEQMRMPLKWEFPGGKIQPGEDEKACLVREIIEEMNLRIEPLQRLTPVTNRSGQTAINLIPFVCRLLGGELRLAEHAQVLWVSPLELPNFDWCKADVPVVEEYLGLLGSGFLSESE